jgi:hypothetical protein
MLGWALSIRFWAREHEIENVKANIYYQLALLSTKPGAMVPAKEFIENTRPDETILAQQKTTLS